MPPRPAPFQLVRDVVGASRSGAARQSSRSPARNFGELRLAVVQLRGTFLPRTRVDKPPLEPLIRCFIGDSSPCVPLVSMSATPLDNASLQEATYLKERRVNIVVRLLAESLVVVLLVALGWWVMTSLGSHSLQAMRYPTYVPGCPLADTTLQKRSAGGGCSKEGVSHPITSRQPGGGLVEHAHGAESHREGKAPPRTSQNFPSTHSGE